MKFTNLTIEKVSSIALLLSLIWYIVKPIQSILNSLIRGSTLLSPNTLAPLVLITLGVALLYGIFIKKSLLGYICAVVIFALVLCGATFSLPNLSSSEAKDFHLVITIQSLAFLASVISFNQFFHSKILPKTLTNSKYELIFETFFYFVLSFTLSILINTSSDFGPVKNFIKNLSLIQPFIWTFFILTGIVIDYFHHYTNGKISLQKDRLIAISYSSWLTLVLTVLSFIVVIVL